MNAVGFDIESEVPTEDGRVDAVLRLQKLTVITEIKQSETKSAEKLLDSAMKQIYERRYYENYLGKVVLLAVAFSGKEVKCRMEFLDR
ncbi:MAG: PD-(D/E)XK nuclease domain-containing protein [Bacteroidales bacterium]|nr:PD-(D/E)XK nuclease domain-containing protein [Bacteroidales bacterium]